MPRTLLALLLALPLSAFAAPSDCLVVGVSDGDTLTVRCGAPDNDERIKVRISGIDAPERRQHFGPVARKALQAMVFMKTVDLDCLKTDRYKRKVCRVMVPPGDVLMRPRSLDAGLTMVSTGMAWWYRAHSREQTSAERTQYAFAEAEAKARRSGLWRDAAPVAPWKWRAAHLAHARPEHARPRHPSAKPLSGN